MALFGCAALGWTSVCANAQETDPAAVVDPASTLVATKKWEEAVITLRTSFRKDPASITTAISFAQALLYSGRREEALSVLGQAQDRAKGASLALLTRRSRVMSRIFLSQATFQTYQDGLNLLKARKSRAARDKFEKALEQERDNVEILLRLGQCLVLEADYDSAAERLRLARKLNPFEPEIRLWLGKALLQRGELSDALKELRAAGLEIPKSELAPLWLAEALVASGQKAGAMQALDANVRTEPLHVRALMMLARMRFQSSPRDPQALWQARRELQLAQSRVGDYLKPDFPRNESELSLDLRPLEAELRDDIQKLLDQIESTQDELKDSEDAKVRPGA